MLAALCRPRVASAAAWPRRNFRAGRPAYSKVAEDMNTVLFKSDHTLMGMHLYHKANLALVGGRLRTHAAARWPAAAWLPVRTRLLRGC